MFHHRMLRHEMFIIFYNHKTLSNNLSIKIAEMFKISDSNRSLSAVSDVRYYEQRRPIRSTKTTRGGKNEETCTT